jgi:hypothetical protein
MGFYVKVPVGRTHDFWNLHDLTDTSHNLLVGPNGALPPELQGEHQGQGCSAATGRPLVDGLTTVSPTSVGEAVFYEAVRCGAPGSALVRDRALDQVVELGPCRQIAAEAADH